MFKINGIRWTVKITSPINPVFMTDRGNMTVGVCDNQSKTIYLANTLKGKELKKVLCHEIVHATMFSYGVSLNYEQEELFANILAIHGQEIMDITNKIYKKLR